MMNIEEKVKLLHEVHIGDILDVSIDAKHHAKGYVSRMTAKSLSLSCFDPLKYPDTDDLIHFTDTRVEYDKILEYKKLDEADPFALL